MDTPPPPQRAHVCCAPRYTEHAINMRGAQICRLQHGFGQHKACHSVLSRNCSVCVCYPYLPLPVERGCVCFLVCFATQIAHTFQSSGIQNSHRKPPRRVHGLPPLASVQYYCIRSFTATTAMYVWSCVCVCAFCFVVLDAGVDAGFAW